MSEMIRKHILFYGRVQGVGFRYHATYKASLLGLTGWVRNLEDGSVEMIRRAETPRDYFATFDCFDIYNKIDFDA